MICSRGFVEVGLIMGAAALLLMSGAAVAQSDGTLEDAYAKQCPNQEENQLCSALRRAMMEAAARTTKADKDDAGPITTQGTATGSEPVSKQQEVDEARRLEEARIWGPIAGREGAYWRGPTEIWRVDRLPLNQLKGGVMIPLPGGEAFVINTYAPTGQWAGRILQANRYKEGGPVRVAEGNKNWKTLRVRDDGTIYLSRLDQLMIGDGPDAFEWIPGRLVNDVFVRDERLTKSWSGRFTRLSEREAASFSALTHKAAEAQRLAEARRNAESGGGLLDNLAMAAGLAMVGGDTETVVRAAVNGADGQTLYDNLTQMADVAQAKAERSRIELERTIANAQAQSAAPDPASWVSAEAAGPVGEAERARRDQEFAAAQARLAEQKRQGEERAVQEANERAEAIEAERQRREAEAARRQQANEQRLAEQQRRQEEASRPIAFKEGVTLCKRNRGSEWRCDGPLQVSYGDIERSMVAVNEACGSNSARDLGVVAGFRAFGCNFGMHPTSDSPGNRDVPAMLNVPIFNRAIYYCPRSKDAYCTNR